MVKYLLPLLVACSCWGQSFTFRDPAFLGNVGPPPGVPLPGTNFLSAYWPLNEGTGTVGHDISGHGRNLYLTSPKWETGNGYNGGASINVTASGHIYSPTNAAFNLMSSVSKWTICMWVCNTNNSWPAIGTYFYCSIVPPNNYPFTWPYPDFGYSIIKPASPGLDCYIPVGHASAQVLTGGYTTNLFNPTNSWVWLCTTRNGNDFGLYTNGVAAKLYTYPGASYGQQLAAQRIQLGGRQDTAGTWQGMIGETMYFQTNLNATDIDYIYHTYYGIP